jgi:hypothetical protein
LQQRPWCRSGPRRKALSRIGLDTGSVPDLATDVHRSISFQMADSAAPFFPWTTTLGRLLRK